MCGISGFISKKLIKKDLIKMTNSMQHRGPNANGHYFDLNNSIGLAHQRLSIIDLSEEANQPMLSHSGRYIMVYNGEIYNYKEIAKKLNEINWRTNSDSEVILEAFSKWKFNFINELNGMFAIAIFDKLENSLHLFRDRIGIKPLYYYHKNNELIFASEIKAFKEINIELTIDNNSIYSYLHLGYIPKNNSIYKEIKKVEPGCFINYKNGKLKKTYYWKTEKFIKKDLIYSFENSKKHLNSLISNSVKKRLISDVPIGTFLSGGTDSSLVTAVAQNISSKPINTFSIGFKEAKYNESNHALKIANHLKTNHTEFILSEKEAIDEIEDIMNHFDEPFADSSALPTMLVSKMAKNHVTVCLSGDGGDELFMGYGSYSWAKRLSNPIFWNLRNPISKVLSLSQNNQRKRAGLVFNSPKKNWKSHIFSQEQYLFSESEINKLLLTNYNSSIIDLLNTEHILDRKLSSIEKQAFFDLNNYLIDDLLVKVDRSSMFTSLEARVPLLDHEIIEYSLNINHNFKINGGIQKYILKEILYDYIPQKIMNRPKWGFSIPLEKWLKNELNYLIEKFLDKKTLNYIGILNISEVENLIQRFRNGENYLYNRIWSLIILNKFLLKNES